MKKLAQLLCLALLASISCATYAAQAPERFEVTGVKAVRPTLLNTIAALKKGDAA
jgi:hypothetical protein